MAPRFAVAPRMAMDRTLGRDRVSPSTRLVLDSAQECYPSDLRPDSAQECCSLSDRPDYRDRGHEQAVSCAARDGIPGCAQWPGGTSGLQRSRRDSCGARLIVAQDWTGEAESAPPAHHAEQGSL